MNPPQPPPNECTPDSKIGFKSVQPQCQPLKCGNPCCNAPHIDPKRPTIWHNPCPRTLVGEINSSHTTVSLARWQVTLPAQNVCPRMVSYHRLGMGINLMLRTDIAQGLDYMIMNIGRDGASWPQTILINIYNQKAQDTNNRITWEWTLDCLQPHIPNQSIPMIIAGDWNIRDPSWDDRVPAPNLWMRETLEWLQGISFRLMNMNEPNVPTREDNNGHASVIDLVFANVTICDTGLGNWSCDGSGDLSPTFSMFVYVCLVTWPFMETVYSSHAKGTYFP